MVQVNWLSASFNCLIIPLKRSHARHFTTDCVQCSRSTDFIVPLDISIRSMLASLNRRRRRKAYWMFRSLSAKAHAPGEHRSAGRKRVANLEETPRLMSDVYFFRARQIFCVCTISQFIDNLFRNTENCFLFARSALAISHRRHKHSNTKCVPSRKPATTNINSKSRSRFQIIAAHLHFAEIDLWMSSARHSPVPGGLKLMFAPLGMKKQFWYEMVLK